MVPSTPNGELASILRAVVEQEQSSGLKFKILETGGVTFKSRLQKSNPFSKPGCTEQDYVPCKGGRGADLEIILGCLGTRPNVKIYSATVQNI